MADEFDNLFNGPEDRPDVPEFWQLSEIILRNDAESSEGGEEGFQRLVASVIPPEVLQYVAFQRASRAMETLNPLTILLLGSAVSSFLILNAASWSDAFVAGVQYGIKYGKEES